MANLLVNIQKIISENIPRNDVKGSYDIHKRVIPPFSAPSSQEKGPKNPITESLNKQSLETIDNVKNTAHQAGRDLAYTAGQGVGVLASGVGLVEGIKTIVEHPIDTGKALYQFAMTDNKMDKIETVLAEKLNNIKLNEQKNTLAGALDSGFEKGKLNADVVSTVIGGAGVAKAGVNIAKTGIDIFKPVVKTSKVPTVVSLPHSPRVPHEPTVPPRGYFLYYERFTSVKWKRRG